MIQLVASACESLRALRLVALDGSGAPLDFASVDQSGPQPRWTRDDVDQGPLPIPILTGTAPYALWDLGQSTRFTGVGGAGITGDEATLRLGCGQGQFAHGNVSGPDAWVAGAASPPSYSNRPFATSQAGDMLDWTVEGLFADTFDWAVTWLADPSLSTAAIFQAIDGSGTHLVDTTIDLAIAPADFQEAGRGWKTIRSGLVNASGNGKLTLRILCPAGGKVSIDAMRLRRTTPDTSTLLAPADRVAIVIPAPSPDPWATLKVAGSTSPIPPGTYPCSMPPFPSPIPPAVTMKVGVNVYAEGLSTKVMLSTDLMGRVALPPPGTVAYDPVTYFPTILSGPVSGPMPVVRSAQDPGGEGLGTAGMAGGYVTFLFESSIPHPVTASGSGTTVVEVESLRAQSGGIVTRVYDCRPVPGLSFQPDFDLAIAATAPRGDGTWDADLKSVRIFPPDPSDPTGKTAWVNPPEYHPDAIAMLRRFRSVRTMDRQGTNAQFINGYDADVDRNTVDVQVLKVEDAGPITQWDRQNYTVAKVTLAEPAPTLFDFASITLSNCGSVATTSTHAPIAPGPAVDLTSLSALCRVLSPTQLLVPILKSGGAYAVAAPVTPASGRLRAVWGSNKGYPSLLRLFNAAGVDPHINLPSAASDDCLTEMGLVAGQTLGPVEELLLEYSNEPWNGDFLQNAQFAARTWELSGGTSGVYDFVPGYIAGAANALAKFAAGWQAAGRDPAALKLVLNTMAGGSAGVTDPMVAEAARVGLDFAYLAVGAYVNNGSVLSGPGPGQVAIADGMTADHDLDHLRLQVDYAGWGALFFDAHRAILAGYPRYAGVRLMAYEEAWNELTTLGSTANRLDRPRAVAAHPRIRDITLAKFAHYQAHGCARVQLYYLAGSPPVDSATGIVPAWSVMERPGQPLGTGTDADLDNLLRPSFVDRTLSEVGAAAAEWNAQLPPRTTPVATFEDLKDAAVADLTAQATAHANLSTAQKAVDLADAAVAVSTPAFAAAIEANGGEVIDPKTTPATAYRATSPTAWTAVTPPSIGDNVPTAPAQVKGP